MKLLRFGEAGSEKPGLLDSEGTIRDLSSHVEDIAGATLSIESLKRINQIDPSTLPAVEQEIRIGPSVGDVRNFVGVGLNYVDHAKESNFPIPKEPVLFSKAPSCIIGPNDDVMLPMNSEKTDWEVEIVIVIGASISCIDEASALQAVAGYTLCNDVSERAMQHEGTGQWVKGKGCPTFGPLGPWVVTQDECQDAQQLDMYLDVNGTRMQTGNTSNMIFSIPFLVSYVSHYMRLEPGDIITTGTPAGVGMGMDPPLYLKAGDEMKLGIEGLGEQHQSVVSWQC